MTARLVDLVGDRQFRTRGAAFRCELRLRPRRADLSEGGNQVEQVRQ